MTDTYTLGQQVRLTASFLNAAGAAADPSTVTFKSITPAGTETDDAYGGGVALKDSTGVYHRDYILNVVGTWRLRAESTGDPTAAAEVQVLVTTTGFG